LNPTGSPVAVHVGHFNNDAALDVAVVAHIPGLMQFSVLLGDGAGSFAPEVTSTFPSTNFAWSRSSTGDIDRDGIDDLIISGSYVSNTYAAAAVYRNDGAGRVALSQVVPGTGVYAAEAADVDGDGWIDMLVGSGEEAKFSVLRNVQGALAAPQVYTSSGYLSAWPSGFEVRDVDWDGFNDVLIAGNHSVELWRGGPQGALTFARRFPTGTARVVRAADFNHDGRRDLAWINLTLRSLAVQLARDHGEWPTLPTMNDDAPSELRDLDHDGQLDLVAVRSSSVRVRRGLGNAQFAAPIESSTPPYLARQRFEDLDGDGLDDFLALSSGFMWMRALPSPIGGFAAPSTWLTGGAADFALIDWDGDGLRDVVTLNPIARSVTVLRQSAPGVLSNGVNHYLPIGPARGVVADFDGDGSEELVFIDDELGLWTLRPPTPGQTLQLQIEFATDATELRVLHSGAAPTPGLLLTSPTQLETWFVEPGGAWSKHWSRPVVWSQATAGLFELDGDDYPELVEWVGSDGLSISRGAPDGGFQAAVLHGDITPAVRVSPGDLNGDGRVDLLVAVWASNNTHSLRVLAQDRDLPGRFCAGASEVLNCTPQIDFAGSPELGASTRFEINVDTLPAGVRGELLYSVASDSLPFAGGTLCVGLPRGRISGLRTVAGPGGACAQAVSFDFLRWLRSAPGAAFTVGTHLVLQGYFRAGAERALSDALDFTVLP